jgi:hypothetical protein
MNSPRPSRPRTSSSRLRSLEDEEPAQDNVLQKRTVVAISAVVALIAEVLGRVLHLIP